MAQNKTKIKENDENGGLGGSKRRSTAEVDHWAFLEEIEAPMWADLTLEPKLMTEDSVDAWFHTGHLFHQLPARQLRSAFAHPDVGNDFVNFTLQGACSPKLPSSVSKSRGKDFIGGQRRKIAGVSVSKSHPVNNLDGMHSRLDGSISHECKPTVTFVTKSDVSSSITSVLCNNSNAATISSNSKVTIDATDTWDALNGQTALRSAVSTSTITIVCQQQHLKCSEVSREPFGLTGGLLNSLKANFRRSYTTRPASRIAMPDSRGQKGRKSSASVTSVDSATVGFDGTGKRLSVLSKTDHRDLVKVDMNVNMKPTASSADVSDDSVDKDRKSSAGKSSVGSSSIGYEGTGKRPLVLSKTDDWNQENGHINVNMKPPASSANVCDNTDEQDRKSSAGKSSIGSSGIGHHGEGKGSWVLPETYHCKQVKIDMKNSQKPKGPKPSTQKSSDGILNPWLKVKKLSAASNQIKGRNSSFRGPEKLALPLKVRVNANKGGEVSVKNTAAGLKQNRPRNSKLSSKSAPPTRGGAEAQQLVEVSVNVKSVVSSRADSRDAATAATCLRVARSKWITFIKVPVGAPEVKGKVGRDRCNVSACSDEEKKRVILGQESDDKYNVPVVRVSERKIPKLKSGTKAKQHWFVQR